MPVGMFTVLFAIPRTSGWISQWLEMIDDKEQKIARPRQIYTGERERDYVPGRQAVEALAPLDGGEGRELYHATHAPHPPRRHDGLRPADRP